jgi:hypothetical protein
MFCCIFISVLSSFAVNAERRPTKTLSDERLGKAALRTLLGGLDNVQSERPFVYTIFLKQRVTMPSPRPPPSAVPPFLPHP